MMFKNQDFTLIEISQLKNSEDVFYYLWMFLFLPVSCFMIFIVPIYFAFRQSSSILFSVLIFLILVGEYFFYTYSASQLDLMNGVYNEILSICLLTLLYFKRIKYIFKKSKHYQ